MRHWLLTNTTYGTWLPGDARQSVTNVTGQYQLTAPLPKLERHASNLRLGDSILLSEDQAAVLLRQFKETADHRGWQLMAVSIMANHFHVVLRVPDDPEPRKLLADLKAYGSRALNREFGRPTNGTWWTTNGSKRKLPDERAVASAVNYVLHKQPRPLVTWSGDAEG